LKEPRYKDPLDAGDPDELVIVEADLRLRMWAKSVYQGGHKIKRELSSDAEVAQVLDWRKEMAYAIPGTRQMGQDTSLFPLRVWVPVAIVAGSWAWMSQELMSGNMNVTPLLNRYAERPSTEWGKVEAGGNYTNNDGRASKAGDNKTPGLQETPFYGHYSEPADALEVSVATRADNATVDTSQWACGGLGDRTEHARERIRRFLHKCWLKGYAGRRGIL
jgi:hypothetical protein